MSRPSFFYLFFTGKMLGNGFGKITGMSETAKTKIGVKWSKKRAVAALSSGFIELNKVFFLIKVVSIKFLCILI